MCHNAYAMGPAASCQAERNLKASAEAAVAQAKGRYQTKLQFSGKSEYLAKAEVSCVREG